MKKIIIDCDPGLDDFIALLLAANEDVEILGITTVAGNVQVETCTRNALDIVDFYQIDTKVYEGANKPVYREYLGAEEVHGNTGLGSVKLSKAQGRVEPKEASDFIIEASKTCDLEVIAIGPLTNIAQALVKDPSLEDRMHLTIMGGGHKHGNVTPAAEFNIYADPEAAHMVFESHLDITMVGLDVTMSDGLSQEEISALGQKAKNEKSLGLIKALEDILEVGRMYGLDKAYLHDPIALLAALDKDFAKGKYHYGIVETEGEHTLGKTVIDVDDTTARRKNVLFIEEYNKNILIERLEGLIDKYEKI